MKGIDISSHNGNVNFNSLKNDDVQMIIIKATEGIGYIDPNFESYYNSVKDMNYHIGFYHYFSEKTNPEEQAVCFWNAIRNKKFDVTPVLDVEINSYERSATAVTDRCIAFLNKFKELSNIDCIVYTYPSFTEECLDGRIKNYKCWMAHYGVKSPRTAGFSNIVGHQYSEHGRVSGISGDCDLNNFTESMLLNSPNAEQIHGNRYGKICELQSILGVEVDGIYGPITEAALKNKIVSIDIQDKALTIWVQSRLGCEPDGIYGPITEAAVKHWQSYHNLVVDGIAGFYTLRSLVLYNE